jgi:hypothetical protein
MLAERYVSGVPVNIPSSIACSDLFGSVVVLGVDLFGSVVVLGVDLFGSVVVLGVDSFGDVVLLGVEDVDRCHGFAPALYLTARLEDPYPNLFRDLADTFNVCPLGTSLTEHVVDRPLVVQDLLETLTSDEEIVELGELGSWNLMRISNVDEVCLYEVILRMIGRPGTFAAPTNGGWPTMSIAFKRSKEPRNF